MYSLCRLKTSGLKQFRFKLTLLGHNIQSLAKDTSAHDDKEGRKKSRGIVVFKQTLDLFSRVHGPCSHLKATRRTRRRGQCLL